MEQFKFKFKFKFRCTTHLSDLSSSPSYLSSTRFTTAAAVEVKEEIHYYSVPAGFRGRSATTVLNQPLLLSIH